MSSQVKTSEYQKPWNENLEDQRIDKDNLSKARKQLERDIVRFSELLPDMNFSENIHFKSFVAFPYVEKKEQMNDVLTGPDFKNAEILNQKLSLQKTSEYSEKVGHLFRSIVGRYVGLHSVIPLKNKVEAFKEEEKSLKKSVAKVDHAFCQSYVEEEEDVSEPSICYNNLREELKKTEIAKKMLEAIEKKNYRDKKFKEHFINFPVNSKRELDIEQTEAEAKYLLRRKTAVQVGNKKFQSPIVMGKQQIQILFKHLDEKLEHQGFVKILEKIREDNVEIFDLKEEEIQTKQNKLIIRTFLDYNTRLRNYFDCQQCKMKVPLIEKGLSHSQKGKITLTDEDDVMRAMEYGDYHHKGFQKAFSRLRSWSTFEDMEEKVSPKYITLYHNNNNNNNNGFISTK